MISYKELWVIATNYGRLLAAEGGCGMKRVIEGKTYNTDTATRVAQYDYENEKGYSVTVDLYQNRAAPSSRCIRGKRTTSTWEPTNGETISRDGIDRLPPAASPKAGSRYSTRRR